MGAAFDPGKDPRAGEQWIYRNEVRSLFDRNGLTLAECPEHKMPGPTNFGRLKRDCEWCWRRVLDEANDVRDKLPLKKLQALSLALEHYKFHKAGVYIVPINCECHFCLRLKHMPDDLSDFAVEIALRIKEAAGEEKVSDYKGSAFATESYDQYAWDAYNDPTPPKDTSLDDFYDDLDQPATYRSPPVRKVDEIPPPPPPPTIWQRIVGLFRK